MRTDNKIQFSKFFFLIIFFVGFISTVFPKTSMDYDMQKLSLILEQFPKNMAKKIKAKRVEFLNELSEVLSLDSTDNLLILVDKDHLLDEKYHPREIINLIEYKNRGYVVYHNEIYLAKCAEAPLHEMALAALDDGVELVVRSGYRPYTYQSKIFNKYIKFYGRVEAETFSAPPGSSQHQLGTAIDFGSISKEYADTPAGKWLYENASKYGWSLSYPFGLDEITGYTWECWHYRYIGKKACALQEKWFDGIQHYTLVFINAWRTMS